MDGEQGMIFTGWQLDLLETQLDDDTFQRRAVPVGTRENYLAALISADEGKAEILSYPDLQAVCLAVHRNDYTGNIHFFCDGGVWKCQEALRRVLVDVWKVSEWERLEARTHVRAVALMTKRAGATLLATIPESYYTQNGPIDQYLLVMHRPKMEA